MRNIQKLEILELLVAQKGRCFYCNKPMPIHMKHPKLNITIDHFVPKFLGGLDLDNRVLCHGMCNHEKGHLKPTKKQINKFKSFINRLKRFRNELNTLELEKKVGL